MRHDMKIMTELLFVGEKLKRHCLGLPGDDGQMRRSHTSSHEQDHVLVPRVSVRHHLSFKGFQLLFVVSFDVDKPDGHFSVPAPVVHLSEAAFADQLSDLQLLHGNVPLLQEDAGLAGLAWEVPCGQKGEIHLLELVCRALCLIVAFLVLLEREQIKMYVCFMKNKMKLMMK